MNDRELREWLGLTVADLLVYAALGMIAAMFFLTNPIADAALAAMGFLLSVAACPLGMKRNPEFSDATNLVKLISYPLCVVLVADGIGAHYVVVHLMSKISPPRSLVWTEENRPEYAEAA